MSTQEVGEELQAVLFFDLEPLYLSDFEKLAQDLLLQKGTTREAIHQLRCWHKTFFVKNNCFELVQNARSRLSELKAKFAIEELPLVQTTKTVFVYTTPNYTMCLQSLCQTKPSCDIIMIE